MNCLTRHAADGAANARAPRLMCDVDMTSIVKYAQRLGRNSSYKHALSSWSVVEHTRVSAEVRPVLATVDPADIRGLGTTLL